MQKTIPLQSSLMAFSMTRSGGIFFKAAERVSVPLARISEMHPGQEKLHPMVETCKNLWLG